MEAQQQPAQAKSIVITLPGQSVTSAVLPVLQQAFPDDRHVFAYDGCMASVQRAMQNASSASFPSTSSLATTLEGITTIAPSSDSTIHSIPTLPYLSNQIRNLPIALSQIPVQQAQVVESWMSSVDAFFALKHDENSNGYLPYVLKYELLMQQQQGSVPDKQDLFWSVASLLQFITGTKSSGLDKQIVEDVMEWLQDAQHEESASTTTSFAAGSYDMAAIENCVFQHKSILIGDKTLQDTVLPKEHWTLKQASRKGGCACCAPEEDEEDDSNTATGTHGNGNNHASTKPSASTSSGFVDGKLSFAFDPTRFS
uniref:Uncharacterized protein n=1 Tax=Craspedostauros australis TaxID=1486917 RepID=A0A7R9X0R4_9STRA